MTTMLEMAVRLGQVMPTATMDEIIVAMNDYRKTPEAEIPEFPEWLDDAMSRDLTQYKAWEIPAYILTEYSMDFEDHCRGNPFASWIGRKVKILAELTAEDVYSFDRAESENERAEIADCMMNEIYEVQDDVDTFLRFMSYEMG